MSTGPQHSIIIAVTAFAEWKSERAAGDRAYASVEIFGAAVADPELERGQDAGAPSNSLALDSCESARASGIHGATTTDPDPHFTTKSHIDEADQSEPVLRRGSKGLLVRRLQSRMTAVGFDTGGVDGRFGVKTEAAVRQLQQQADLVVDGIVGPKTWAIVNALENEGDAGWSSPSDEDNGQPRSVAMDPPQQESPGTPQRWKRLIGRRRHRGPEMPRAALTGMPVIAQDLRHLDLHT